MRPPARGVGPPGAAALADHHFWGWHATRCRRKVQNIGLLAGGAGRSERHDFDSSQMPEPTDTPARRTIKVVLCDDVPALRTLMRAVIDEEPGLAVVGEAGDGEEVVAVVERLQPDIVLLDLAMPGVDGLQATPRIVAAAPGCRVIGLSGFSSDQVADQMLAAGAVAYLEKGVDLEVIVAAVLEHGGAALAGQHAG